MSERTAVFITCEECGKELRVPPSQRARRFCSWQCRTARPRDGRSKKRVLWQCEVCAVRVLKQPSETKRRFCSLACRDAFMASDANPRRLRCEATCRTCGVVFETHPSRVKLGRGLHCSRACAVAGRKINGKPSAIASEAIALFIAESPVLAVPEMRVGRWSIDLALPIHNIAVELDGAYWHSLPAMQDRDRRKDDSLTKAGWSVRRVPIEARDTPETIVARMRQAVPEVEHAQLRRVRPRRRAS